MLASADVVVQDVEVAAQATCTSRYGIEAVPTIVVADAEGVVRASVGAAVGHRLWAAVAGVREPGSEPLKPQLGQPDGSAWLSRSPAPRQPHLVRPGAPGVAAMVVVLEHLTEDFINAPATVALFAFVTPVEALPARPCTRSPTSCSV